MFRWLLHLKNMGSKAFLQVHEDDFDGTSKYVDQNRSVLFHNLKHLPKRAQLMTLARSYLAFIDGLRKSDDCVVCFVLRFMDLASDYELFARSIRIGDAVTVERLMIQWLPIWKVSGKNRYFRLTLRMIEVLYG